MRLTTKPDGAREIRFAENTLWLDPGAAIYWPAQEMLIVSDLHLEKASFLASAGNPLPLYDTHDTLARLDKLLNRYPVDHVVCLGDSFHDAEAVARFDDNSLNALVNLCERCAQWSWVLGNHDPEVDSQIPGRRKNLLIVGNLTLSHEPLEKADTQIIGHFHPKMTQRLRGQRITGKCFLQTQRYLMMPAFGSFTGGLDSQDEAIRSLTGTQGATRYLIWRDKLWHI